jgi:CubicO group peptidase (beta-lactamase class C family)
MHIFSRRAPFIGAVTALVCTVAGCGGGRGGIQGGPPRADENPGLQPVVSLGPESTGDGWRTATPADEGIDPQALGAALERVRSGQYPGVDAVLVARNQRLVAESYFNGFGRDSLHDLRSTGKSFTSALAGIAISQGLVSLEDPIAQHLPGFENHSNVDAGKRAITLRNLLHMNSGLACNDWDSASPGNEEKMYHAADWVNFILDLPMSSAPGVTPSYCTGGVIVLGHVLSLRSGQALDAYAQAWLFDPLNIQHSDWRRSPDGRATGGGGLRLRPRDAAKLGALFANEGVWNGARVVPESWVLASRERVEQLGPDGYGLLWWKRSVAHGSGPLEVVFTSGNGGNFIFTVPALELVVVFTGSNYNGPLTNQPFQILPLVLAAVR